MKNGKTFDIHTGEVCWLNLWCTFRRHSVTTCRESERVTGYLCKNSLELGMPQILVAVEPILEPTY